MHVLLFTFIVLVSLIYALEDPKGSYKSDCLGPWIVTVAGKQTSLYYVEIVTLTGDKQFESEQQYHYDDGNCTSASYVLVNRFQGTFETQSFFLFFYFSVYSNFD